MQRISKLSFVGDWRIIIRSKNAAWDQRVLLDNTASGTQTLIGIVGLTLDVYGRGPKPWKLRIQHNDGQHGWQDNWLRPGAKNISGSTITQVIESEDITTSDGDHDFDDLVICLEKLGMADQPSRPFAVWPTTMQMMPDGIFEASLGRYFMAVRVRNIWTEKWPADAMIGLTQRCRQWLTAGGIVVVDEWSTEDQAVVNQIVINGLIQVGALEPWESRLIYFKIDVAQARVRKHNIEIEVLEPAAEDLDHINRKAKSQIFVSRTSYDAAKKVFVSECDRGTLTVAVRELAVDYNTFKRAVGRARQIFRDENGVDNGVTTGKLERCDKKYLEGLRRQLRDFLDGKQVNICAIWRTLQCYCASGGSAGNGEEPGGVWGGKGSTGMEFFSFPTVLDYKIQYAESFTGQYGPIPFDDPWWKVLLMIIAIILTIASAVSAAADLADKSDDVVIGRVTRSVLNAPETQPDRKTISADQPGSVDAAVVLLNGNRGLTNEIYSYLDAQDNENNTNAMTNLNGHINTNGAIVTNAEINKLFQDIANSKGNPTVLAPLLSQLNVFKSGARTGTTKATLVAGIDTISTRRKDNGGTYFFINQLDIVDRGGAEVANSGDSGSLWLIEDAGGNHRIIGLNHAGCTNLDATANRIEDVLNALDIHFA